MVELKHTQKFTNSQTENVCECFQFTYHTLRWKLFPALASHSHTSISVTKQYDVVWFLGFAVRKVSIWYWVCTTNYLVYVTMSSSSDTEMNIPPMVLLEYGFQQQKYEINAMHRYHIQHETEWLLKWLPWQHAAWLVTDGDDLEVSSSRFFGNGRLDSSNNVGVCGATEAAVRRHRYYQVVRLLFVLCYFRFLIKRYDTHTHTHSMWLKNWIWK